MVIKPRIISRIIDADDVLPETLHPVLKRVYLSRGITDIKETQNDLKYLLPFDGLAGIQSAATILAQHISAGNNILIVGDYDADGATSCALAVRALTAMGASNIDYLVPNRFEYGYGLTPQIVDVAKQKSPNLIITVDNGIASIEGVRHAKQAGINVLVTDHHLPGNSLPEADAIVNPNQPGDRFPSKNLAGVGVIFYLMAALRQHLRNINWFEDKNIIEPNLGDYLDLVALGTVADVVKLDHNNRILVAQGIARMRAGKACAGIRALLKVSGRDEKKVVSSDLGFCLGPRLNAAGRLDDISIGIDCLLTNDEQIAMDKAAVLDKLNRERRDIEQTMREQADFHLERLLKQSSGELPSALCLYDSDFHEGVIGILAGRLKEYLHRPVIVFAKSTNGLIKGSARSIPGLHIRDALDRVATQRYDILSKFGGHAMAAGLTINEKDITVFTELFVRVVDELLDEDALQQTLHCDGELTSDEITLQLAETLQQAGPWGQGFPEPQFEGCFESIQKRIVGEHHLKLVLKTGNNLIDAIAFRTTDEGWPEQVSHVNVVYKLDVNEFNGRRNAQLIIDYIEPVA